LEIGCPETGCIFGEARSETRDSRGWTNLPLSFRLRLEKSVRPLRVMNQGPASLSDSSITAIADLGPRKRRTVHPICTPDSKPNPSNYPSLARLDVEVDKQLQFPELLLAVGSRLPYNCYCTLAIGGGNWVYKGFGGGWKNFLAFRKAPSQHVGMFSCIRLTDWWMKGPKRHLRSCIWNAGENRAGRSRFSLAGGDLKW
jgi:hypothetical protein